MQGFCPLFVVSLAPIIAQIAGIALCRNAFWVGQQTLITSANLSYHGQEGNLELGTYSESPAIARQIDDVFTQLIFRKVFTEV